MSIPSNYPSPFEDNNIDLLAFKKKTAASDFYDSLPPDARFQFFQDGTSGFVDGRGNKYTPPPSIDDRPRNVSPINTDTIQYNRFNTSTSNTSSNNITQGNETVESSTTSESGSDFLTNVGGVGATTFDYDLSEADLLEAIDRRKSAYGSDVQIQTSSTTNAAGEEEKTFIERAGDRLHEIFVSGPSSVVTRVGPVSDKKIAVQAPGITGIINAATIFTPLTGLGRVIDKMGNRFVDAQVVDAEAAALGMANYGGVQVQDLGTGQIIDLTTSPAFGKGVFQSETRTAFMNALKITNNTSVGTYAESQAKGPFVYNGVTYSTMQQVVSQVAKDRAVSPKIANSITPFGPAQVDPSRVVDSGQDRMGIYDSDSGEVDKGFGRSGAVTGVALDGLGNLHFSTGRAGFVTMGSKGQVAVDGRGQIAYGGNRADIISQKNLTSAQAQDLLNKVNSGEISSSPKATAYLQSFGNPFYNQYGDDYEVLDPPFVANPVFGSIGLPPAVTVDSLPSFDSVEAVNQREDQADADTYQMQTSTPLSERTPEQYFGSMPTGGFFTDNDSDSNDNNGNFNSGDNAGFSEDDYSDAYSDGFADGGTVGMQEGGVAPQQQGVSQIVQGAGFIAPQGNASPDQTVADDIPLEAEEGDFIINAPAAQFAGRQDIVTMITEAIESLREKGVDIQYGNPKIPVERSVKLAVSRNEVYIPKAVAEEIGYDKLQKINKRGQKEVQRRQEEAQGQAARGGFVAKADGDVVTRDETLKEDKSSMIGTDEGSFIQDIGRAVYQSIKDNVAGFLSPKETEKQELKESDMPKSRPTDLKTSKVAPNKQKLPADPMKDMGLQFPENSEKGRTFNLLTLLETLPKQDTRIGYIPKGSKHNSGVTVGLGFDIGQHSPRDLLKFKFSNSLYNKLIPYSGKKLDDARQFIAQNPLNLTNEELSEINIKGILDVGMREFEKQFPEYKNVPVEDKAILYSAYHVGGLRPDSYRDNKQIKRTPDNPKAVRYGTFDKIYRESGSIQNALSGGILDIIKNQDDAEWNRANKAKSWVEKIQRKFMGTPKSRPSSIKPRPKGTSNPTSSFLNSPTMG